MHIKKDSRADRQRDKQAGRRTETRNDAHTDKQSDGLAVVRQTDRHRERQTYIDRQTNSQTDI